MRATVILSSVVLAASLVAGCGGGGDDGDSSSKSGYCKDLKSAKSTFDTVDSSSPDLSKFDDAITTLHDLADEAPSAVDEDWKVLDDALTSMEDALSDAGLKASDLGKILAGQLPEGMTQEELQAAVPKLQTAFSGMDTQEVKDATDAIEKHAKSVCNVSLSD